MTTAAHFEALLKERIGLDAATVGPGMIERALRERLVAAAVPDHHAYWNLLHSHPDELQSLIEAVVVPETWFFRHREALLALGRFAAMRVFGNQPAHDDAGPLRILSVPCSTGEEPYSIVMALLDAGVPEHRIQVDAVDVSARALERARIGQYGNNSFRGAPLDFRDRHFTACTGGYALKASVRGKVRLLRGNLLDPGLMANEPPYHFVFCRNLLIYFDPPTQRRSLNMLERLSRPDATLFVGPAEASLLTRHGFVSAGVPLAFAFTRRSAHQAGSANPAMPLYPTHLSAPARAAPRPWPQRLPRPLAARGEARWAGVLAPLAPAPGTPNPDKAAERAKASADALSRISRLADRGELAAAVAACVAHLDAQGPSASAYCLLGVLYDATGRPADARESYRRALYLDPAHQEALYHMAAILEAQGDGAAAARLRDRAQRKTPIRHG
ncbi:CheR family methyltransferase [Cupriavidus sp. CV2]|uniref:CheR family methyltransferase n=1 Tax=Cupriavidus ulmosensis TaxID=3065913 RepID=UPI00296AE0AF|nr:CheR family methyltransferase [Cupriavidus sp. CV2]MDW3688006.1 CheR family methyltransferase [Cupriavidus sp. CV2]